MEGENFNAEPAEKRKIDFVNCRVLMSTRSLHVDLVGAMGSLERVDG